MRPASVLKKGQPWRYGVCGMTLLELLVALVVFAMLGVMGYRAISSAVSARERISEQMQRWRAVANFWQVLENDLTQQARRPDPMRGPLANASSLRLATGESRLELSFLKLDGAGGAPVWRGYRFDGKQLLQLRWASGDAQTEPQLHPLLAQVTATKCTVITADQVRHTTWPDKEGSAAMEVRAVELEVELADVGTLRRLFAF